MMLITTYSERQTRHHEKIQRLLNFLKEETYSDFKILMLLFGFRDHKSLYSLLSKVEDMGLIQKIRPGIAHDEDFIVGHNQ
jgi:hypothetical protein